MNKLNILVAASAAVMLSAHAIPSLQLDIDNGTYSGVNADSNLHESTITTENAFQLQAYGNSGIDLTKDYYISIALTPKELQPGGNYGSFVLNGTTVDVTADMAFGTPPLDEFLDGSSIPDIGSHGIFETYYYEYQFNFDVNVTEIARDVQGDVITTGNMYAQYFNINTTNLQSGKEFHFDLYSYELNNSGKKVLTTFAPFSHDAGTNSSGPGRSDSNVPDTGATIALMGFAFVGLGLLKRRK